MQSDSPIAQRWRLLEGLLTERQRRALAAAEARVLGRGGVAQVIAATGVARNTVAAGMLELDGTANEFIEESPLAPPTATRRSGGGRKTASVKDLTLVQDLLSLVDPNSSVRRTVKPLSCRLFSAVNALASRRWKGVSVAMKSSSLGNSARARFSRTSLARRWS
jgi:hypothetical protein